MTIIRLTEMHEPDDQPGTYVSTGNYHCLHGTEAAPLVARLIGQPMVRAASGTGEPWPANPIDLDLLRAEWSESERCPIALDRVHAELMLGADGGILRWLLNVTTGLIGIELWQPVSEAFTEALDGNVTHQYTLLRVVRLAGTFITVTGTVLPDHDPIPGTDDTPRSTLTWYQHAQLVGADHVCDTGCSEYVPASAPAY